jgi:hypothetical protein
MPVTPLVIAKATQPCSFLKLQHPANIWKLCARWQITQELLQQLQMIRGLWLSGFFKPGNPARVNFAKVSFL